MLSWRERFLLRIKLLFGRLRTAKILVGVLIHQEGRYLLIEEKQQGKRCLNIPAGHLELGEDPFSGAKREAKEESGLEVELLGLRMILFNTWKTGLHYVYYIFDARPIGGTVKPEKGSRADWLTLKQWKERMVRLPPAPALPDLLEAVQREVCIPMEAVYFIDRRQGRSRQVL